MKPIWIPKPLHIESSNLYHFIHSINHRYGYHFSTYKDLYDWSVMNIEEFWDAFWDYSNIVSSYKGEQILTKDLPFEKTHFFPEARLNYAENLLRGDDKLQAIVFWGENKVKRSLSLKELRAAVHHLQFFLKQKGIKEGDRVAGYMPNMPETLVAMLATVSIGAIWTSCSPDFGRQGVIDRFSQTCPKVLFTADGYFYQEKWHNCLQKAREIKENLPNLETLIVVPYGDHFQDPVFEDEISYRDIMTEIPSSTLTFTQVAFNHPLFILYSSGTTGVPKCIVHGHGGTLLQHKKEHQLHCDIRAADRIFYYTTCGWMMWNWLASALASQATVMLYDGSPFYPRPDSLFNYAETERFTFFGTSAKYIESLRQSSFQIKDIYSLSSLRSIASTGSPLSSEGFDYIYTSVAPHVHLSSLSGGTDIVSCFALGNPMGPVWRGELQVRGLGLKVEVYNEKAESIVQEKGELVCTAPFPSMPLGFWGDYSGEKFHEAYFQRFPHVWHHGDFVELTAHDGLIIYGRSDCTLNPGGVRIGTAEIYNQVEKVKEVKACVAVGQEYKGDTRIILFVQLKEDLLLSPSLIQGIKEQIRQNTTPRHVPSLIISVPAIPRTLNGKLVEQAVTQAIHNRPINNREAIANPETLDFFKNIKELQF